MPTQPHTKRKGPATKPSPSLEDHHNPRSIVPASCDHTVAAADKWALDLERRVGRAARDTAYYILCPEYVRVLADELRAGGGDAA